MSLAAGVRLGPYEIHSAIGAGGMGEVWRARDTTLGRDVALKILPDHLALDPDRLARFKREAQILASLNHPNIATIHGFQESDGVQALVLELVDGPTLADRIARGPIPIDDALPIAKQIADALEAAHEQGIIHRDLKPANIKLRPDGTVKVLDFGLAKAFEPAGTVGSSTLSMSPTITSPAATMQGVILGTAAYMSPEQARGKFVDKRADIWAFGCVLYEMLTGRRAFDGDDVTVTLARVVEREPIYDALPPSAPSRVQQALRVCLRKDPKQRVADIRDVRLGLEGAFETAVPQAVPAVRVPPWGRVAVVGVAVLLGAAMAGAAVWVTMRPGPPRVSRLQITPSSTEGLRIGGGPRSVAVTPDGARVVYAGVNDTLVVRALDQLDGTLLTGLGRLPRGPFISPDGQWIGFVADDDQTLKKVAITGGPPVTLASLDGRMGGAAWGPDGAIVFATGNRETGLLRLAPDGGEPTVLTRPNHAGGEGDHSWPEFLPGGQAVLFTIRTATNDLDDAQVAVLDLRTMTQTTLIRGGANAHYVRSGHLVYGAAGQLRAVAFDLARLAVVGVAVPIVPAVVTTGINAVNVAVAGDGTVVYVPGVLERQVPRTLVWVDRQGREAPLKTPARNYASLRLSPDETRVALEHSNDIWIWDLAREALTRLTFDPTFDQSPVWTRDGQRILFGSGGIGFLNIVRQAADGTGTVERLTQGPRIQTPTAISPDGTQLVFRENMATTAGDIMMLTLDNDRKVQPLMQTPFVKRNAEISPDGRWLAYESNEPGQYEIYVRPFPDVNSSRSLVSVAGGTRPVWAKSGQELFYLAPSGALMTVPIEPGSTWKAGTPAKLFDWFPAPPYDVSDDGRRFLMLKPVAVSESAPEPTSLVVVQHLDEELKRVVPTN